MSIYYVIMSRMSLSDLIASCHIMPSSYDPSKFTIQVSQQRLEKFPKDFHPQVMSFKRTSC